MRNKDVQNMVKYRIGIKAHMFSSILQEINIKQQKLPARNEVKRMKNNE